MKLHKNIFKITEDNIKLLLYLYEHPQFTVESICEQFTLKYQTFFKYLKEWVNQGFIIEDRQPPALGQIKYKYSLSEGAIERLNMLKKRFLKT